MISIIVPIYNAERYLKTCIDSLIHQSYADLQIILVDDGSTDGCLAIAQEYARKDPRIEVYHQSNAGQSVARNTGMQHAKGEFIAFVDADDYIASNWCERHLNAIEGVDYVQSGYNENLIPRNRYQFTSPCMRLYRKQLIQDALFTPSMIYEDVVWSIDLWLRDTTCRRIRYAGYHYTVNPDGTTSRRHPEAEQRLYQALKDRLPGASLKGKMIILYTLIRLKLHFFKS